MKKVWIDTDPGVDDTFAIAMLLEAADQVEVIGFSTIFGNADVDQTTKNMKILLEAAGKQGLPLAKGVFYPLFVPLDTSPHVHGVNGMGDMLLPEPSMEESKTYAPQAIIDVILSNPHEITLLLIGPLTNAAMAVLIEPSIVDFVKEVVIMGGAVRCPGNITPAAEANFFHDPHAAQIVLRAGWPISLAPLDVCAHGMIPQAALDRICTADKALAPYIAGGLPFFQTFLETFGVFGEVDFPDALAAAYLLEPGIFTVERTRIFVETEGSCQGQSVEVTGQQWYQDTTAERKFSADYATGRMDVLFEVNTGKFIELIVDLLA
jgi:purine nucleosidase